MTELQLYKFITDNNLEWNAYQDYVEDIEKVLLFVPFWLVDEFSKLLGASIFDDEGLECVMKDGYFCFHMIHICEYFGIEIENVFKKPEQ